MRYAKNSLNQIIDAHDEYAVNYELNQGSGLHCLECDAKVFYKPSEKVSPHFSSYALADHASDCHVHVDNHLKDFKSYGDNAVKKGDIPVIRASKNTIIINETLFNPPKQTSQKNGTQKHKYIGTRPPRIASADRFLRFINNHSYNETLKNVTFKYGPEKYKLDDLYFTKDKYKDLYRAGFNNKDKNPLFFIETRRDKNKNKKPSSVEKNTVICDSVTARGKEGISYSVTPYIHFHDSPDGTTKAKDLQKRFLENRDNLIWAKPDIDTKKVSDYTKTLNKNRRETGHLHMDFHIFHGSQIAPIPSRNKPAKQLKITF